MNHPLVRRYRHRALVLWLSVVSLLLFIGIQAACYVIASHPRWLFILSFFVPNLIALTWGVHLADRRGLERGIILLGVAGVSFLFIWAFLASAVFTLVSNPPSSPYTSSRAKSRSLRTVLCPKGAWQRLRAPAIRLIDVNL